MPDYTREWADEVDERTRRTVERAVMYCDDLATRRAVLRRMVDVTAGPRMERARRVRGPSVPIRVDVVDLLRDLDGFAVRYAALLAGALRAGGSGVRSIPGALAYIGTNLGPAAMVDPSLADDVEQAAGKLRWRARRIAGEVSATFPVDTPCPDCGLASLWVHPGLGVIRCGVSECGGEWSVGDLAVPAWSGEN